MRSCLQCWHAQWSDVWASPADRAFRLRMSEWWARLDAVKAVLNGGVVATLGESGRWGWDNGQKRSFFEEKTVGKIDRSCARSTPDTRMVQLWAGPLVSLQPTLRKCPM